MSNPSQSTNTWSKASVLTPGGALRFWHLKTPQREINGKEIKPEYSATISILKDDLKANTKLWHPFEDAVVDLACAHWNISVDEVHHQIAVGGKDGIIAPWVFKPEYEEFHLKAVKRQYRGQDFSPPPVFIRDEAGQPVALEEYGCDVEIHAGRRAIMKVGMQANDFRGRRVGLILRSLLLEGKSLPAENLPKPVNDFTAEDLEMVGI